MDIDDFPRRAFDPAINKFDAKACRTTVNRVANFKAHHRLSQDQRLSPGACALRGGSQLGGDCHQFTRVSAARDRLMLQGIG